MVDRRGHLVTAICALGILLIFGCGDDDATVASKAPRSTDAGAGKHPTKPGSPSTSNTPITTPTDDVEKPPAVIAEPDDDATYIYDQKALRTYELSLAPEDLARIDANPTAEEYVQGMMHFEGRDYGPVGIRYKGSVGAFIECLTGYQGAKVCTKLSMKVSFNWVDPDGRFYGLKKLQFHAMNRDPSMLKERLGYALFREFGIAAPRAVHARLLINGKFVGLFALVEQIDGRFTRSRFSEGGKGNLYKEAWPLIADGSAIDDATLRPHLQTNEDQNPPLDGMLGFASALEHADLSGLSSAISKWTDVDYAMRYVAVDRTTADDDGPFHWYCGLGPCSNHNYYWYEQSDAKRLWIINWDLDSSFNLDNTTTTLWFPWEDDTLGCNPISQPPYTIPQRAPLCDKLILGWARLQKRYLDDVQAFLDGPLHPFNVEDKLQTWEAQIAPVVDEAAAAHDDAVSAAAWADARAALRSAIAKLRKRAIARIKQGAMKLRDPRTVSHKPPPGMPRDAGRDASDGEDAGADLDGGA